MVALVKVYVAGPVAGKANDNRAAFDDAAHLLRMRGHEPIIPLDVPVYGHDGDCPPGPIAGQDSRHTACCFMRSDIMALLGCDAVYFLDGWEQSTGSRTEFEVARSCGLFMYYQNGRQLR
jgi:hypothetical protein